MYGDDIQEILNKVEEIRRENNKHWMDILRLAFVKAPYETRELMAQITKKDKKISELTEKLAG